MRLPSDSDPTRRADFVQAALQEAARYEAETAPPENLVSAAMTRHDRAGRDCARIRIAPTRVAMACGLVLAAGILLRLSLPSQNGNGVRKVVTDVAGPSQVEAVSPNASVTAQLDSVSHILPPIDLTRWAASSGSSGYRHRTAPYHKRSHRHLARLRRPVAHPVTRQSVWSTETVQCEVVTQTVTPVWIARPDPETATVVLTPALFQLALQPDNADTDTPPVSAALIPVRLEQENTTP